MVLKLLMMRRRIIKAVILVLIVFPISVFAQKLKTSSFDPKAKQWYFETFPVNVKSSPSAKMNITLRAVDTTVYLYMKGSGVGTSTVDKDDQIVLLLDNNAKVNGRSLKLQAIEYGDALPYYEHEYVISLKDLETLGRFNLRSVKKFAVGAVEDITPDAKNLTALKQASNALLEALKKEKIQLERPSTVSFAPAFPGGKDVYVNFLNRNFKAPEEMKTDVQLNVKIKFTVLEDGTPTAFQVQAPTYTGLDRELQRILGRMPKWKPAFENNKSVARQVEQTLKISKLDTTTKIFL